MKVSAVSLVFICLPGILAATTSAQVPQDDAPPATSESDNAAPLASGPPDSGTAPFFPQAEGGPKPRSLLLGPWLPADQPLPADVSDTGIAGEAQDARDGGDGIMVARLESLDPAAIGLWLDPDSAPFPSDLWRGSKRADIETLFGTLPAESPIPAVRALAMRLLLSATVPPPAEDGGDPALLLKLKLERLAAAGALEPLVGLFGRVPAEARDPAIMAIGVDALLAFGDYGAACRAARETMQVSDQPRWLRIVAFCDALDGDRRGAGLRLALLAEASADTDPLLSLLVEALLAEIEGTPMMLSSEQLDQAPLLDPLLYSFARLLGLELPDRLVRDAPALLLLPLSETPAIAPETRSGLAMKAASLGLIPGERLADLIETMVFSDEERLAIFPSLERATLGISDPAIPPLVTGVRLDALIYHMARSAGEAGERLRWIEIGLERADAAGDSFTAAALYDRLVSAIPASVSLAGYGRTAGRIHLMNGRTDEALAWLFAAEQAALAGDDNARRARDMLLPLMLIADESGLVTGNRDHVRDWWQLIAPLLTPDQNGKMMRLALMLELFGHEVPDEAARQLLAAPAVPALAPSAFAWRRMLLAERDGLPGAAILAGLAGAGTRPDRVDPAFMQALVATLVNFGYEADARRLAIAILAGG